MAKALKLKRTALEPHEDYGFFGPDSVTWKVWTYPTSLTVGFQRAVVVEELDPALVASVDETRAIRDRPRTRYDRTVRYFAMVALGDARSAVKASDVLVKVHSKAVGIEPISGERYDANDPHSQLWIHLTAWHSILYTYEKFGPGKLSQQDEERYWYECAVAAELQTCDPADVPRTREGIREYFEQMRPQLLGSEVARSTMEHLLDVQKVLPALPKGLNWINWMVARAMRIATVSTMPHWMREMSGIKQSRLLDVLIVPVMKIAFWVGHNNSKLAVGLLRQLSPATVTVAGPVLLGIPARNAETQTPAQARERYGFVKPAEAHLEWRAKQRERVFDKGQAPSDAGLVESEPILGKMVRGQDSKRVAV